MNRSAGEEAASDICKISGWLELVRQRHLLGSPAWIKITEAIEEADGEFRKVVEVYGLDEATVERLLRIKKLATAKVAQLSSEAN